MLPLLLLIQSSGLDVTGAWIIPPDEPGGPDRGTVEIVMEDGAPVGRIATVGEAYADDPGAGDALGTVILWGFERDEDDGRWEGGRILDPEADKTYKSKLERDGDTLLVKGCVAFICQTQEWARAAADLAGSDAAATVTPTP